MNRIERELAAFRAAMADSRTEGERTLDEAAERLINTVAADDGAASHRQPEPGAESAPEPRPAQSVEQAPVVLIRHGRHRTV